MLSENTEIASKTENSLKLEGWEKLRRNVTALKIRFFVTGVMSYTVKTAHLRQKWLCATYERSNLRQVSCYATHERSNL